MGVLVPDSIISYLNNHPQSDILSLYVYMWIYI